MSLRKWLLPILCIDLALWFGGAVYFSMFAALELSKSLAVDDFGKTIGILFPTYFTLMAITAVVGWFLVIVETRLASISHAAVMWCRIAASVGAIIALVNRFYFLPAITAIEAKMGPYSQATTAMQKQFGMTHGISMLLDFVMIVCVLITWIALGVSLVQKPGGRWQ